MILSTMVIHGVKNGATVQIYLLLVFMFVLSNVANTFLLYTSF